MLALLDNDDTRDWYKSIDKFRLGQYENASPADKKAWFIFQDCIMPVAVTYWKPNKCISTRKPKDYSSIVTSSDEAFVLLVVKMNAERWIKQQRDKRDKDKETELNRLAKKNWTWQSKRDFFELHNKVKGRWERTVTGVDWDNGFRQEWL